MIEALNMEAAAAALREYKNLFNNSQLVEMSEQEFQNWKDNVFELWEATVNAERAYYRAKREEQKR